MKKGVKTLIIILVIIGIFILYAWLSPVVKKWARNYERINDSKTLTRYIENHDQEHTYAMNGSFEFLDFDLKDIDKEVLGNNKVTYFNYKNDRSEWTMILDNNKIYETVFGTDRIYSNNKKYMEVDLGINIKRISVKNLGYDTIYFISEDDKCYELDRINMTLEEIRSNYLFNVVLKDKSIKNIVAKLEDNENDNVYTEYLVLKTDGQVYKQSYGLIFNSKTNDSEYPLLKEEVYLSSEEYGKITEVEWGSDIWNSANSTISYGENTVVKIVSEKGLYYLKQTNLEECKKYADIKPTFEMAKSEIYEKYKEDILSINCDYVFTKDGNVIKTGYLCNPLDKDVK